MPRKTPAENGEKKRSQKGRNSRRIGSVARTHKEKGRPEDEDSDSDEERITNKKSKNNLDHPSGFEVPHDTCRGSDGVSSIDPNGSVTNITVDQERWRKMEERLQSMEDRVTKGGEQEGVSVVSGATVTPPANERILKENLRKFVAEKVFPNWKFIFKKDKLELCVVSAITKSFITVPPGYDQRQLAELYSPTVRACLDGCRANAQTAARKRYLSKYKFVSV